ncbi:MAG: hypothetical protein PHN75_07240 [Syntrophales bacterium]|nr:hypothetical protein [Syntrophales bacterium]
MLRDEIISCLEAETLDEFLSGVRWLPPCRAFAPLIACLFHADETIRWHAVSAPGVVVTELATEDMERAWDIMRRLMWSLDDESGVLLYDKGEMAATTVGEIAGQSS